MRFRSRVVDIDAEQFADIPACDPPGVFRREEDGTPYVVTIHGQRCYLSPGDWIVPEPDGVHYYPVKPDIMDAKYYPLSEPQGPTKPSGKPRDPWLTDALDDQ